MLRIVKGDRHAFRILVDRYQGPMYNFFLRSGCIPEDAEDLTQQLFIKLFSASYKTRDNATFRTFIYRMATNLLIDHTRRRGSDRLVFDSDLSGGLQDQISSGESLPDRDMEATQLQERYMRALDALPREWKIVMELRVTGELNYREIAESTGLSVPAVESILFRARERLGRELKEFRKDS
ncbi:MAG: sigma-70 family RNA polymerase sigma factor [Candidatus Krumholzibacteria bacterium]|nr:sigma-70 family RNA polymerase sigma factor [Candidatus Krumholzibacteria bacterium]